VKTQRYEDLAVSRINDGMGAMGWDMEDATGAAECVLIDLRHWCRKHGVRFPNALRSTRSQFADEVKSDGPRPRTTREAGRRE
jgi:hypothetical protein